MAQRNARARWEWPPPRFRAAVIAPFDHQLMNVTPKKKKKKKKKNKKRMVSEKEPGHFFTDRAG